MNDYGEILLEAEYYSEYDVPFERDPWGKSAERHSERVLRTHFQRTILKRQTVTSVKSMEGFV